MIRVKVNSTSSPLGESAVATSAIDTGCIVVNEPPLLVLPHTEVLPTTAAGKQQQQQQQASSASSSATTLVPPSVQLMNLIRVKVDEDTSNSNSNEQENNDTGNNKLLALDEFEKSLLPALQKAESIASKFGLSASYFAPLVMAHFTMSKTEIKDIMLRWLVSHVELVKEDVITEELNARKQKNEGNNNNNNKSNINPSSSVDLMSVILNSGCKSREEESKRQENVGFSSIRVHSRELGAATKIIENLETILTFSSNDVSSDTDGKYPTALWWKDELVRKFVSEDYQVFCKKLGINNNSKNTKQQPQFSEQETKFIQVTTLLKWLHGVRINVHSDDVNKLTAVFKHACKFNHSCSPNTFWYLTSSSSSSSLSKEDKNTVADAATKDDNNTAGVLLPHSKIALQQLIGNAVHIATRPIKAGEPCTFSYVGCGLNMLSPTPQRRNSLSHLNFVCACERCKNYDNCFVSSSSSSRRNKQKQQQQNSSNFHPEILLRPLICGECFGRAKMMFIQQSASSASSSHPPPHPNQFLSLVQQGKHTNTWRCTVCGVEPKYEDYSEALMHETMAVDQVMFSYFVNQNRTDASADEKLRNALSSSANNTTDEPSSSSSSFSTLQRKKDLRELWLVMQKTARQVGTKHYICAVAVSSFVSHLYDQAKVVFSASSSSSKCIREASFEYLFTPLLKTIEEEKARALHHISNNKNINKNKSPQTASPVTGLISLVTQTLVWFQSTVDGTPQHARFRIALSNLVKILSSSSSTAKTEEDDSSSINGMKSLIVTVVLSNSISVSIDEKSIKYDELLDQLKMMMGSALIEGEGYQRLKEYKDMQA